MTKISKANLDFLKDIKENNNREWFAENKDRYETAHENMKEFANAILVRMQAHDDIERLKLYRIYRDVRFSKDKSPYKYYWWAGLRRATAQLRGGYVFSIEPNGESVVGGGFYSPNKEDLKLIRDKIAVDDEPLRKILANKTFKKYFGTLQGNQLKTAPRGYEKDHPAIDLLRYKQFYVHRSFSDASVLRKDYVDKVVETFLALRPYFDHMSEVLTTDMNGEPMYD